MAIVFCMDDDADLIRTSTHGMMSNDDLRFFRDRLDTAMRSAGSMASDYLKSAADNLASFNLDRLRDRVEAMRDRFTRRFDDDSIRRLPSISDFQNAKPTLRKYIMADPRVRKLYQQGRVDGFGELYHDDEPGAIGRNHTAYREMMNGSHMVEIEDEEVFVTYLGVRDENDDEPLTHRNKVDIRANRVTLGEILDRGKQDPTSVRRKTL